MHLSKNRAKAIVIILTLLMTFLALISTETVNAQVPATNTQEGGSTPGPLPAGVTADVTIHTVPYLSFRPNPVGVNQPILVNLWVTPSLHVSKYLKDYTVTFIKPDGTTDVIKVNSYRADATAWFEYPVDQVGTWKVKFEFPGGYFPAGNYTVYPGAATVAVGWTSFPEKVYYKPSSTKEQTLIVQENMVASWPPAPLPTDYWTRPVLPENREWWTILGSYPGTGYVGGGSMWDELYPNTNPYWSNRYSLVPWVQAPNTAHILWKRTTTGAAGLIGGQAGAYSITSSPGTPSIIYNGRCYQTITKPMPTTVNGTVRTVPVNVWQCYDLRTGEVFWEQTDVSAPTDVEYASPTTSEVPGAEASGTWSVSLIYIGGGRLIKYNPSNGAVTANVSISPLTSGTYYMNSLARDFDPCALSVQDLGTAAGANRYRLINWTTRGSSTNFTSRIKNNVSWPMSSVPDLVDFNSGIAATTARPTQGGVYNQVVVTTYSLKTGQMLCNVTSAEMEFSGSAVVADHGKIAVMMSHGVSAVGGYFMAWDVNSGKLAWVSETMDYPWGQAGFGAYSIQSAYGKIFWSTYDGIYAFDWDTGKIAWRYKAHALADFEGPYHTGEFGIYPFRSDNIIADGKVYAWNTEHTTTYPLTRGWGLHCINATTGELIWKIIGPATAGGVADGYLTAADSYDGYMYVFGKGKSSTTVTAPKIIVSKGTGVVIEGTVLDQSPAQLGTPCVSRETMSTQMQYLHKQMPIDGLWHNETIIGVPVALTAISTDGASTDLGTVTTDGYYGTFTKTWIPDKEGDYKIIASFAGDDSYSSSSASTVISVGPTAAEITIPEQVLPQDYIMTIIGVGIVVVIAVAISTVLILRKRS
ncbi:MAG TPA: PQQ-binding-like beta-propeller repeat protein [Candidatus Sulfotelmatobacter sp.]|nr:PQQ-binding-like beta-propeller repeat protein [Candidatus Sulfotelmatobacter sp.]